MNLFRKTVKHLADNATEYYKYYTLFVIVFAVPLSVGAMVGYKWALLISFILQALIGILFIKGSNDR